MNYLVKLFYQGGFDLRRADRDQIGERRNRMAFNFNRRNPLGDDSLISTARALARARSRNRNPIQGGSGCPIIVEGRRDLETLRALGFEGPIELVNLERS